jgi:hypothetical protein
MCNAAHNSSMWTNFYLSTLDESEVEYGKFNGCLGFNFKLLKVRLVRTVCSRAHPEVLVLNQILLSLIISFVVGLGFNLDNFLSIDCVFFFYCSRPRAQPRFPHH